ncbi:MAG: type II toxin-antitoxin system VapC family toxin [Anaerolineae bacterium]
MIYLPDTNAWVAYLNPGPSSVKDNFRSQRLADIAFCSVVKAELLFGAYRSARIEANLGLLKAVFQEFRSLPFDDAAAEICGRLRADLAARGTPIGPNDLMIASIALAHDVILVTHNTREFSRVIGLRLADWA